MYVRRTGLYLFEDGAGRLVKRVIDSLLGNVRSRRLGSYSGGQ